MATQPAGARILIADDEPDVLEGLALLLEADGHEVTRARDVAGALEAIGRVRPDLALVDLRMPGRETLDALPEMLAIDESLPIVIVTGFGTVEQAVSAMRLGAYDFLEKPIRREILAALVERALAHRRLRREVARLRQAAGATTADALIGDSEPMHRLREDVRRVAGSRSSVLITGESGTGKELVARALHFESERAHGPWVAVNCAALAGSLLEAELFGYERGAFTGADPAGREGLFEQADGGTLFLDEIGEMDLALQSKLLRALEDRRIRRLGATSDRAVDIRVVAATNRDLRRDVEERRFRADLYFRLAVVTLAVPPLRERRGDWAQLARAFLAEQRATPGLAFDAGALRAMEVHAWPGNVRELRNAVERAAIVARGNTINADDLALARVRPGPGGVAVRPLMEVERELIDAAMRQCDQNVSLAARLLGIHRSTLHRKLVEMQREETQ